MEKQGDTITMWFSFLYLLRIFSVLDLQIAKQIFADFRFFSTWVSTWKIIYVSPASYLLCIVFPIKTPPVNMGGEKEKKQVRWWDFLLITLVKSMIRKSFKLLFKMRIRKHL